MSPEPLLRNEEKSMTKPNRMRLSILVSLWAASALGACFSAQAHHSYSEYDQARIVEIEGTLVSVALYNPHVHFGVKTVGSDGRAVTWRLEATSLNWIERIKVPSEIWTIGGHVKFAGWPSRRSGDRMYALNMLAADGREILLFRDAKPRWSSTTLGFGTKESASFFSGGIASGSDTLFRVWASHLGNAGSMSFAPTQPLALTESAKKAVATFDPIRDTTTKGCAPKGMPVLMSQPPPMEILTSGDTILLRTEEYELVRTIHMTGSTRAEVQPRTPLGYSVGRWDGKTLLVETTRVSYPYLNNKGIPLSPNARFVERFTPAADGTRLDYSLTVTDPGSLLAPAEFRRFWVWRPGEKVLPYRCVEQQ
jgi:hypothetical protein